MSMQQHIDARLDGYRGPYFPEAIDELQLVIDNSAMLNNARLTDIVGRMPNFVSMDRLTTQDGYTWFLSLRFEHKETIVIIMLPWANDKMEEDGSKADRSIAVHTTGEYQEEAASLLLEELMLSIIDDHILDN